MKRKKREDGALYIEGAFVFPIMFVVILFLIVAGNAFLQKCRVDAMMSQTSISAAAYCIDPQLKEMESGDLPKSNGVNVKPYRYVLNGYFSDVANTAAQDIRDKKDKLGSGLFADMFPQDFQASVNAQNFFIYGKVQVDVSYRVKIPIKLLWADDFIFMNMASHAEIPVLDAPEFIRNVNMAEDYLQQHEATNKALEKIEEAGTKVKEWVGGKKE